MKLLQFRLSTILLLMACIDKGLVLLMFENHSTQLIWRLLHQNAHIQKGLQRLEFRHVTQ
jgi:hypothetical protein